MNDTQKRLWKELEENPSKVFENLLSDFERENNTEEVLSLLELAQKHKDIWTSLFQKASNKIGELVSYWTSAYGVLLPKEDILVLNSKHHYHLFEFTQDLQSPIKLLCSESPDFYTYQTEASGKSEPCVKCIKALETTPPPEPSKENIFDFWLFIQGIKRGDVFHLIAQSSLSLGGLCFTHPSNKVDSEGRCLDCLNSQLLSLEGLREECDGGCYVAYRRY